MLKILVQDTQCDIHRITFYLKIGTMLLYNSKLNILGIPAHIKQIQEYAPRLYEVQYR